VEDRLQHSPMPAALRLCFGFVSGHDSSRAVNWGKELGFSPASALARAYPARNTLETIHSAMLMVAAGFKPATSTV
jgi:hypothetical protein